MLDRVQAHRSRARRTARPQSDRSQTGAGQQLRENEYRDVGMAEGPEHPVNGMLWIGFPSIYGAESQHTTSK